MKASRRLSGPTAWPAQMRYEANSEFAALYTGTLFKYGDEFLDCLGPALELGRSFVRIEYQKGFAPRLLLWKRIGKLVGQNPQYKVLFGPVSISNQYQSTSRRLMASFLERYVSLKEWAAWSRAGTRFDRATRSAGRCRMLPSISMTSRPRCPIWSPARQAFPNVDPQFVNALDGLIVVDPTKTEPKLLERYLGKHEAAQFLSLHRGKYGAH